MELAVSILILKNGHQQLQQGRVKMATHWNGEWSLEAMRQAKKARTCVQHCRIGHQTGPTTSIQFSIRPKGIDTMVPISA